MNLLYLIPIFCALILGFLALERDKTVVKRMITPPFKNEWANELYIMSYSAPFKWFINENESDERVRDVKKLIIEANESHRLNYRAYTTLQFSIMMLAVVAWLAVSVILDNSAVAFQFLFNVDVGVTDQASMGQVKLVLGVVLLATSIVPKYYLKTRANRNKFYFLKDLPILQLFIILMLKARRPLSEVLYVLSTTNTAYRQIFDTGYRIYIRDKREGLQYLREAFAETRFLDTIQVLESYGDYSKSETLNVLENGLKDITEHTNTMKRRKDIGSNVFSQISLVFPFLSALLLCFGPVIAYGMSMMQM